MDEPVHPVRKVGSFFDRIFERAFCVAGAFVASQFPMFYTQYLQNLSGHLAELTWYLQRLQVAAETSKQTLPTYVSRFLQSSDPVFIEQGRIMEEILSRAEHLQRSYHLLAHASPLRRFWLFLQQIDMTIAQDTLGQFLPGFVWSLEGILYATSGLLLGWVVYRALRYLLALLGKTAMHLFRSHLRSENRQS